MLTTTEIEMCLTACFSFCIALDQQLTTCCTLFEGQFVEVNLRSTLAHAANTEDCVFLHEPQKTRTVLSPLPVMTCGLSFSVPLEWVPVGTSRMDSFSGRSDHAAHRGETLAEAPLTHPDKFAPNPLRLKQTSLIVQSIANPNSPLCSSFCFTTSFTILSWFSSRDQKSIAQ